jgi:actin-related protein 4
MATPNQFTAPGTEYGGGTPPSPHRRPPLTGSTDEVSAIVLDPGYATTRAGFAGEDAPKSVIPTYYGLVTAPAGGGGGATNGSGGGAHAVFGDNAVHEPRPHMEMRNPLAGGGADEWVADWDAAARLWEHAMTSRLTGPRRSSSRRGRAASAREDGVGGGDVEMADVGADAAADAAVAEAEARAEQEAEDNPLGFHPLMMSEPGRTTAKAREKIIEIAMENWEVPAFYLTKTGVLSA